MGSSGELALAIIMSLTGPPIAVDGVILIRFWGYVNNKMHLNYFFWDPYVRGYRAGVSKLSFLVFSDGPLGWCAMRPFGTLRHGYLLFTTCGSLCLCTTTRFLRD